jgi:hypothetical protein
MSSTVPSLSLLCAFRVEDGALTVLIDLALITVYLCAILIKSCEESASICASYGLGETSSGEASRETHEHVQQLTLALPCLLAHRMLDHRSAA